MSDHPTLTRLAQRIADSANRRASSPDLDLLLRYDRESDRLGLDREEHDRILVDVIEYEAASRMVW